MTNYDKKYYRQLIEDELDTLSFDLQELEELCKPIPPDNAYGRISRMDAINQKSRNEALLSDTKIRQINLNKALENIEAGEYGICSECKQEISKERLSFLPETNKCRKHY